MVVWGTVDAVVVGRGVVVVGRAEVGGVGGRPDGSVVALVVGNWLKEPSGTVIDVVVSKGGGATNDGGGDTDGFRLSSSIDAVYTSSTGTPASAARM